MSFTQEEIHRTLCRARDYLAQKGLAKGQLTNADTGAVCLRGALNYGMVGNPLGQVHHPRLGVVQPWRAMDRREYALMHACEAAMGLRIPYDESYAARWNNLPGTTLEMVLARFDAAIAATAPKPSPAPVVSVPAETALRASARLRDDDGGIPETFPASWLSDPQARPQRLTGAPL